MQGQAPANRRCRQHVLRRTQNVSTRTIHNPDLPSDQRLSWLVSLLPYYIDREAQRRKSPRESTSLFDIYDKINRTKAWDDPANREATTRYLRVFVCPGHPSFNEEPSPGPTYYMGIAGLGTNAAELPRGDPKCGFFGSDRTITPDDVTRGLSAT